MESNQNRQLLEGSQHLEEGKGAGGIFHLLWLLSGGKTSNCTVRAAKSQKENPESRWLEEQEDRVWGKYSCWRVKGELLKKKERGRKQEAQTACINFAQISGFSQHHPYVRQTSSSPAKNQETEQRAELSFTAGKTKFTVWIQPT